MKSNELRDMAKAAPIFSNEFNSAADKIDKQNEALSIVAEIATKRNDSELFEAVANYGDKAFINKIKAEAVRDAIRNVSNYGKYGNYSYHVDDLHAYAIMLEDGEI